VLLPYGIEVPIRKYPWVTYLLIGLNTLFFLFVLFIGAERRDITFMQWGFIPDEWSRFFPLLTSMFLHGGWIHFIGNMYFLWIFGRFVEDKLGSKKYIGLYLAAGVIGNVSHLLTTAPFFADLPCIGASGAISGILGAFIVMAPYTRIKTVYFFLMFLRPLFGTIELPSLLFIGGWFLMQLLYTLSLSGIVAVGVAYWAHIGGFLFGVLAVGAPKIYRQGHNFVTRWVWQREFAQAAKLAQNRDLSRAGEMLETLKATNPEAGDLNVLLSQIYFQGGDIEKARILANTTLKEALRVKNQAQTITAFYTLRGMGNAGELKAHDYLILGRSFAKYQKMKQAIDILIEALGKFPGDTEVDLILYELGDIYLRVQDYERAKETYTILIESYPSSKLYKSAKYCLREIH
jgi:membrane associated rhomboid family serine protease